MLYDVMFVTASSVGAMLLCTLKLLHYSYLLLAYCCRTIYTIYRKPVLSKLA